MHGPVYRFLADDHDRLDELFRGILEATRRAVERAGYTMKPG